MISLGVLLLTVIFVYLFTREFFLTFATNNKLIGGFIKFFFLASIGDFIGLRLKSKQWQIPKNMFFKAVVWGLIGIMIAMVFTIFNEGITSLQTSKILPFGNVEGLLGLFFTAFFTSVFMNLIFAPTMMAFHRVSDQYLEGSTSIENAISDVNWVGFYKVVLFKTIPFFWIPMHTVTFMLPKEYQVIFAAVLGIALGLLLSLFKK